MLKNFKKVKESYAIVCKILTENIFIVMIVPIYGKT